MDHSDAIDHRLRVTLESLVPGVRATGVAGTGSVEIVSTKWFGSKFLQVTYRDVHGATGETMLRRDDEPRLRLEHAGATRPMDADADQWRLGAEALRIRYAALFDPMLAVTSSNLEPLPHQIKAVYSEMLPRTPLRFLLADDPGAGKTIMCGLYIKELMLRGDLARCLVVAPGSLVDQWQDELYEKFNLRFDLLTRSMIDSVGVAQNVFERYPLLIARMDQLSRSDDLRDRLSDSDWDLVVVDEAHRMSAHYFGHELSMTKRYTLGLLLGRITRHLLLMTATPHAGKEEDFQLFLALLDGDRFEGRFRDGVHTVHPHDLMRRMVKEELLTMDGKPLFPERLATTVPYALSEGEQELYEVVTAYVRDEMGRADRLDEKQGRRRTNVGLALTVLQRRLASSPEAILRSLERRRGRLEKRLRESTPDSERMDEELPVRERLARILGRDAEAIEDLLDDLPSEEREELEELVVDSASAAQTRAELQAEIVVLDDLVEVARRVRTSETDRKWTELRAILSDQVVSRDARSQYRKIIVFTEHRDTLEYLRSRIADLLGDARAVVTIHGGVRREDRRKVQELFTQDKAVQVLVATDAAGEGLNLQRAHLMVNYDLPWNPNRIEQRFGRIHRIGQREVCHLWNLVARNTREGDVYLRLLQKVEQQRAAYGGKVFDVLGDAFDERPLRDLIIEAIRYGDRPETRAQLDRIIDASVGEGIQKLLAERALHHDSLPDAEISTIRVQLEHARAGQLQPHHVQAFFTAAFRRLGGTIARREPGRFEITNVPLSIRDHDRQTGFGAAVLTRYERVCFDPAQVRPAGMTPAQLLAPGHPLLEAVVDLTVTQCAPALRQGTVLVDPADHGTTPRLLVASNEQISDGHEPHRTVSKRFAFVELSESGRVHNGGPAPYLDYRGATDAEQAAVAGLFDAPWLRRGAEDVAVAWAVEHTLDDHIAEVRARIDHQVGRVRTEVRSRLLGEISHWDAQHARLLDLEAAGKDLRMRPETAERRARDLEVRLTRRIEQLDADERLTVHPPVIAGAALVVPQGLLSEPVGGSQLAQAPTAIGVARGADDRAVAAVMAAERQLGAAPEHTPDQALLFDVRSMRPDGHVVRIKVISADKSADTVRFSRNQVIAAKNLGDDYRLAVADLGAQPGTGIRYAQRPFDDVDTSDFRTVAYSRTLRQLWSLGGEPR